MTQHKASQHFRTCNLCEAMCGVVIEHAGEEILSIKGDKNDPHSKGHICPKALGLKDFHEDPDRLRVPQIKTEDGWKQVSWNKAFNIIANKVKAIQKDHGKDAVGVYVGNPNVHHHGNILYLLNLFETLETKNRFSATSNDQLPHMRANYEMFGHQALFPVPDIDHTDLYILIGCNPAASNGSLMSAPDYLGRLKAIRKRGGQVILIDPKKSETARVVDQHLPIKPGTDALMLMALIHTLFDEGLVETGRLKSSIEGIADVQLLCTDYQPERVADICGMPAQTIRDLARKLATTPRAAIFGRMGTSTQEFGGLATWLVYVANILTNHLDERGGLMFTKPAADLVEVSTFLGEQGSVNSFQSKSGLPEFSGELPANTMADQIEIEGPNQIKAMFMIAGNPVLSSPNSNRLDKAFAGLDFMVSVDSYLNETSKHADVILPSSSHLEQSHYDVALNMIAVRNVAKYSPPLFKPAKNTKHDWEIILEIARRLQPTGLLDTLKTEARYQTLKRLGPDGVLDLLLRVGPYGTQIPGTSQIGAFIIDTIQDIFPPGHILRRALDVGPYGPQNRGLSKGLCVASLMNYPHGVDLGSLQSSLPERLFTQNKRIKLVPPSYSADMPRLRKFMEQASSAANADTLSMIGRRDVRSNNSWMHNSKRLVKGKNRCTMQIHPDDAAKRKISNGEEVRISSKLGSIQIPAEITDDIMQGVVSVPHGWGHNHGDTQLSVASVRPGVNVNILLDDGFVDKLTGTSVLNGVPVQVEKIAPVTIKKKRATVSSAKKVQKSRVRVKANIA
jgi:anaerobic selenocysteine-containing dehydrogenase